MGIFSIMHVCYGKFIKKVTTNKKKQMLEYRKIDVKCQRNESKKIKYKKNLYYSNFDID